MVHFTPFGRAVGKPINGGDFAVVKNAMVYDHARSAGQDRAMIRNGLFIPDKLTLGDAEIVQITSFPNDRLENKAEGFV